MSKPCCHATSSWQIWVRFRRWKSTNQQGAVGISCTHTILPWSCWGVWWHAVCEESALPKASFTDQDFYKRSLPPQKKPEDIASQGICRDLQNGTNGIKIFFNVPMINDSDIKKQRETDVSFVKFHWDFASENMTLCVTRGVVVIALMSPAPAVHVDASDPGFMNFTYPAVLRKSKSIPWIRLSRVFVESLWVLFICLCFVHVCPFGRTDIGHVTCWIYGTLWKSKFSYWSLSWLQMFDARRRILEICWKLNRSICHIRHICPLPTWLFWSGAWRRRNGRCSTLVTDSGAKERDFRGQQPVSIQIGPSSKPWVRDLGWWKNGVGGGPRGEGWERVIGDHSLTHCML